MGFVFCTFLIFHFTKFIFSEEIFPIDQVLAKTISIRCLAELDSYFLNSTEVPDLETSWISDDGTVLSPNNTITFDNISKKVSLFKFREIILFILKTKTQPSIFLDMIV